MRTKRTIYPGQPGSKKWLKKYGPSLVCIRYKYDEEKHRKRITIELVVEECDWHKNEQNIPDNKIVAVKINYGETELGKKARSIGAQWDRDNKVWKMTWKAAKALGLQQRVVK